MTVGGSKLAQIGVGKEEGMHPVRKPEKNVEMITHVWVEPYLTRAAASSCRKKHCIDMVSHSFVQHKFVDQLLGTRHCTKCESWIKVSKRYKLSRHGRKQGDLEKLFI